MKKERYYYIDSTMCLFMFYADGSLMRVAMRIPEYEKLLRKDQQRLKERRKWSYEK